MKFIFTTMCEDTSTKVTTEFDAEDWVTPIDRLITLLKASACDIGEEDVGINKKLEYKGDIFNLAEF
jgi:hypothetical protein